MTNPTLLAQDTPWGGYTLDSIVESLLGMRGLTNDASTGRTVAIAAEDADCKRLIKSALDDLHAKYPSVYAIRSYTTAWTQGDHSIALPANAESLLAVTYGGLSLRPLSRDDYFRLLRSDEEGGGLAAGLTGTPAYYRVTGVADVDAGTDEGDQDYRLVVRIYPTPETADQFIAEYVATAHGFENDGDMVPLGKPFQRWCLHRAAEIWGAERGDDGLTARNERERLKVEDGLFTWLDGMRDRPSRATTRYPHVTRSRRFRRR